MNFRHALAAQSKERRVHTPEKIAAIKRDLAAGMTHSAAARAHGVSRWIVRYVAERLSWRDVEPDDGGEAA